jgi:hypothetical protein
VARLEQEPHERPPDRSGRSGHEHAHEFQGTRLSMVEIGGAAEPSTSTMLRAPDPLAAAAGAVQIEQSIL